MRIGELFVDRFDCGNRQNITIGFAAKFIGAVRRSARNRQGVAFCFEHKIHRLIGIGQQLILAQLA